MMSLLQSYQEPPDPQMQVPVNDETQRGWTQSAPIQAEEPPVADVFPAYIRQNKPAFDSGGSSPFSTQLALTSMLETDC